jgi:hypothetical protein
VIDLSLLGAGGASARSSAFARPVGVMAQDGEMSVNRALMHQVIDIVAR